MGAGTVCEVSGAGEAATAEVLQVEADGTRIVQLSDETVIDRAGAVPLPPYIHRPLEDAGRYQTVYARADGSVAAPTAGLHFTEELLDGVRAMGAETVFVTLHVGWDSFRPVWGEDPSAHRMHSEWWELGPEAANAINRAKQEGRRVVSVGTTAVRLLEQAASLHAGGPVSDSGDGRVLSAGSGWADLFILPGYRFRVVDALATNFHLPRSTLLMLTSAFAGRDLVLEAYHRAIDSRYRFYSFGDAMFIV
jgi:S-adenosylmethionine:tRNA ribosyltransferase-isomerase